MGLHALTDISANLLDFAAISRHAVVASTELAALTGVALAALPSTDSLIAALLIKAASDKKFIRLEAEAALVNFANGT